MVSIGSLSTGSPSVSSFSVGQPSLIFYFQPEVMFLSKWPTFGEVAVL